MFYEKELRLLCDTFKKCRVRAVAIHISSPIFETIDTGIDDYLLYDQGADATAGEIFGVIEDKTLYRYTDGLGRCFSYLRLPAQRDTLLLIGPYVSVRPSQRRIFELGECLGISPKNMKYFEEYYTGISVVEEGSPLFVMLSAFCERIWEQPSFAMVDANAEHKNPVSPINETAKADSFDDVIVKYFSKIFKKQTGKTPKEYRESIK